MGATNNPGLYEDIPGAESAEGPEQGDQGSVKRPEDPQSSADHLLYVRSLDGLRGIAILLVMAFHFQVWCLPGGFLGVDLFFVLSGFLITSILLIEWQKSGGIDLRRFYWRRAFRLFPALLLLLLFVVLLFPDIGTLWPLLTLSYLSNWALAFGWVDIGPLSHVWSLSVEEQFYVVWPIALLCMLKWCSSRWSILGITAALALSSAMFKVVSWESSSSWLRLYHGSDGRADALLIGCFLAMVVRWNLIPRHTWVPWVVQALALGSILVLGYFTTTASLEAAVLYRFGGLTLVAAASGAIILSLVIAPIRPVAMVLEWSPLVAIGKISYGLYLWHHAVSWLPWDGGRYGPLMALYFHAALSFAGALLSYRYLERPALRLRDRWHKAKP